MIKSGQINLSFGMIFSIILIIVFLAFAFYAIKTWLNLGDEAKIAKFVNDIQSNINDVWTSDGESSSNKEYNLPPKIDYVCFVDINSSATGDNAEFYNELKRERKNMVFYPLRVYDTSSANLKNINLYSITSNENPYCIKNNGKISLTLSKDYGEGLVTIKR